jgi:hypothetical protein
VVVQTIQDVEEMVTDLPLDHTVVHLLVLVPTVHSNMLEDMVVTDQVDH